MSAPILSELEWMGWEVRAARILFMQNAWGRALGLLVRHAPNPCSNLSIALALDGGRDPTKGTRSDGHVKVAICKVRAALKDIGLTPPCSVYGQGYALTSEAAAAIHQHVLASLPHSSASTMEAA